MLIYLPLVISHFTYSYQDLFMLTWQVHNEFVPLSRFHSPHLGLKNALSQMCGMCSMEFIRKYQLSTSLKDDILNDMEFIGESHSLHSMFFQKVYLQKKLAHFNSTSQASKIITATKNKENFCHCKYSNPRFTYNCIYGATFAMVLCFLGSFGRRGLHSPSSIAWIWA